MKKLFAAIAALSILAGCASTDTNTTSTRSDIKNAEVRTGTRLPPRDPNGVKVITGQDYKQDSLNRTTGDTPK